MDWDSPSVWGCIVPDLYSWTGGKTFPFRICPLDSLSHSASVSVHMFQKQRQGSPFCHWINTFVLQSQWQRVHFLQGYFLPAHLILLSLLCPLLPKMRKMQMRRMRMKRNYHCRHHCRCCRHCCCCHCCYYCSLSSSLLLLIFHPVSLFSEGFLSSLDSGQSLVLCPSPLLLSFLS